MAGESRSSRTWERAVTSLRFGGAISRSFMCIHVHPVSEEDIAFEVSYPAPGTYRLFLQYSVGGEVRTAAFTIAAG
jgi:hypothetical protein